MKGKKIIKEESVHLCEWPEYNKKKINDKLEEGFKIVFDLIEKGLAERDKFQIGLKWPLQKAILNVPNKIKFSDEMKAIIIRQLNVKELELKKSSEISVELDTKITPELEAEGYAREFARYVQSARKNLGLKKSDVIKLKISTEKKVENALKEHLKFLENRINAASIEFADDIEKKTAEFEIKGKKVTILFCNFLGAQIEKI